MFFTKSTTKGPVIQIKAATVAEIVSPELLSEVGNIYKVDIFIRILTRDDFYLDALDPHDEPADVAGHLGYDGEPHHEVVMGADEQDGQHQRGRGQHHAHAVNPPPPETICNVSKRFISRYMC